MSGDFLKFPSTPHLAVLPGLAIRADKVLGAAERDAFLNHDITVEEKVDGANLGISLDGEGRLRAQNRGGYLRLPEAGQWKLLDGWLRQRAALLSGHLGGRYMLFGEWCYARHSIFYGRLPDWFLAFDVFDRVRKRFLADPGRGRLLDALQVARVPQIACGRFSLSELVNLAARSRLTDAPAEGVYLRLERGGLLEKRAKLVNPAFVQTMEEHWSRGAIIPNRLRDSFSGGKGR